MQLKIYQTYYCPKEISSMNIITLTAKDIHRGLRNVNICYPKPKHQLENNGKCENQFKDCMNLLKFMDLSKVLYTSLLKIVNQELKGL